MENRKPVVIFWFRRDLRFEDNAGLYHAMQTGLPVLPLFIFDDNILKELPLQDARVQFIHQQLQVLHTQLQSHESSLLCKKGNPIEVWSQLIHAYEIAAVYTNRDYEPYAQERDSSVEKLLDQNKIPFHTFKDQVIFEKNEVQKDDGKPYAVFTPYKRKWLFNWNLNPQNPYPKPEFNKFYKTTFPCISLSELGFEPSPIQVKPYTLEHLKSYAAIRDYPALDQTSYLSVHLRFGTIGIRQLIWKVKDISETFWSELIWREFFMQILYHFPQVVNQNFYIKFDAVQWRNNETEFKKWCEGQTGYPMVDAGMRQLNQTGYMHNRVRMVVASFLTKHLLIDWRWGEAYFAEKLLDYDLSANNGNWQWAAGTGCDAAPYFRVFNPSEQLKKFDKELIYIKKWVPELGTPDYPLPMVDHVMARKRALETYGVVQSRMG
jgi:deoxyribodipyrimidine photo-lyase